MSSYKCTYEIPDLPLAVDLETAEIYKALAKANRNLAELKGLAISIPNQGILIDSLALQEAKASSEIENIVTTQDDLFKDQVSLSKLLAGPAKEVALYRDAIRLGWENMTQFNGIISNRSLVAQFQLLKGIDTGFRTTGGTVLRNDQNEVVYVPPQIPKNINRYMADLEQYINEDELCDLDPLIKMAIIHHQFESIHPFSDGNGRIGRILNVLYLVRTGLLDTPILYLSRYITLNKPAYYQLLQRVRDATSQDAAELWQQWVLYMLTAVADTAKTSVELVRGIREQMSAMKQAIRDTELRKIYSQDLINNLFRHPYTRIEFIERDLSVTRKTATKYLESLADANLLKKFKEGRNSYYVNYRLVHLFVSVSE
jgi:Fic family protein